MQQIIREALVLKKCAILLPYMEFIKKLYCLTFRAIYSTNAEQSDAHMRKGSIKNCSIVELYNKVKNYTITYMH